MSKSLPLGKWWSVEELDGFKKCPRCKEVLAASTDNFNKNKRKKDGLRSECKWCSRAAQKQRDQNRGRRNGK